MSENVGNAGKGRAPGSKNKRTLAALELMEAGETPVAFGLRLMRDDSLDSDLRMAGARLAAPYVHPKPQPEPRFVSFELPETIETPQALLALHAGLLRETATGGIALEDARELSAMLETHRRLVETVDLENRIAALERTAAP